MGENHGIASYLAQMKAKLKLLKRIANYSLQVWNSFMRGLQFFSAKILQRLIWLSARLLIFFHCICIGILRTFRASAEDDEIFVAWQQQLYNASAAIHILRGFMSSRYSIYSWIKSSTFPRLTICIKSCLGLARVINGFKWFHKSRPAHLFALFRSLIYFQSECLAFLQVLMSRWPLLTWRATYNASTHVKLRNKS